MSLDQDLFQVSKLSEDQKKGLHQKRNTFFPKFRCRPPPKKVFTGDGTLFLSTDLRSDAHQSQIIRGDADEDHTQIVGGYIVKLLGGYILPHPPWFRHH